MKSKEILKRLVLTGTLSITSCRGVLPLITNPFSNSTNTPEHYEVPLQDFYFQLEGSMMISPPYLPESICPYTTTPYKLIVITDSDKKELTATYSNNIAIINGYQVDRNWAVNIVTVGDSGFLISKIMLQNCGYALGLAVLYNNPNNIDPTLPANPKPPHP